MRTIKIAANCWQGSLQEIANCWPEYYARIDLQILLKLLYRVVARAFLSASWLIGETVRA